MGQGKVELSRSWKAGRVWMDRAQRKGQGEGWGQGPATGGPESAGPTSHGNQPRLSAKDQLTAAGS